MQPAPPSTQRTLLNPAEAWWTVLSTTADRSTQNILTMESRSGRHQHSVYELYAEMELKDGHLFSVLQTRLSGLLGLQRRLVPGEATASAMVDRVMGRIPRFEALLRTLLTGIARGFAVVELEWAPAPEGGFQIAGWIEHPQEYFAFDEAGALLLRVPPFPFHSPAGAEGAAPLSATTAAPERKFLVLRFQADVRNPYGRGLCQHAYWHYFFKKNALKFWAIFNEKYA